MHRINFDLNFEELSKVEGHAGLDIAVRNGRVKDVRLRMTHNKRFFTSAVIGKQFSNAHQILSRICGTCSIAHIICSIKCMEDALGVIPSKQTKILRDLSMYGMTIRDHAMHLYLFCLPDIFGKDSVLEFADNGREHDLIHKAFQIKEAGNILSKEIAGRAVHPVYPIIGSFPHRPTKEKARALINMLEKCRDAAIEFVDIFNDASFIFESDAEFIGLSNPDFSFQRGELLTSGGLCIPSISFRKFLQKTIIPYSQAPGFSFQGRPYMVGALARLNVNLASLNKRTKKSLSSSIAKFPSINVYHNNLAQAIEIVHSIDHSIEFLDSTDFKEEPVQTVKPKEGEGVGLVEAPRGTLYHHMKLAANGSVTYADLVIPTSQNQVKMENDIGRLVQQRLDEGKGKEAIRKEVEVFIRAFDPCMSCATHFLKIKWG
jgi:coenzyme F420-reducing hydrogenase alpha subunit